MKIIWILIQINAVYAFVAFGITGASGSDSRQIVMSGVGLVIAALLEYVGYKYIYKPAK